MALFQFASRRLRVVPFSSAVISTLPYLIGLYILGRIVWHFPSLHLLAAGYLAVLVFMLFWQLNRIHRAYDAAGQIALTAQDDTLARALNEMTRTFRWGSSMLMLVSLGVWWAWFELR
jgi:hypothetical protein